jgi:hypothetical protein
MLLSAELEGVRWVLWIVDCGRLELTSHIWAGKFVQMLSFLELQTFARMFGMRFEFPSTFACLLLCYFSVRYLRKKLGLGASFRVCE